MEKSKLSTHSTEGVIVSGTLSLRRPRIEGDAIKVSACGMIHHRPEDPVVSIPPAPEDEAILAAADIDGVLREVRDALMEKGITGVQLRTRPVLIWIESKDGGGVTADQLTLVEEAVEPFTLNDVAMMIVHSDIEDPFPIS